MVKISVICTVKNGERLITDTIKSIIEQTIPYWEFIIIDDGSSDSTPALLEYFSRMDSRIKVLTTEGIGRVKALNLAIQRSQGEYIANIDADDPSHPQRLEMQLKLLEERKEIFCSISDFYLIKGTKKPIWSNIKEIELSNLKVMEIDYVSLLKRNPINHSSLFIRKNMLDELGRYNEKRRTLLDYDLWLRLVSGGGKIYKLPYVLTSKRIHSNQAFERKKRLRYLVDTRNLKKDYIKKSSYPFKYMVLAEFSVFYGLLPQFVRYLLKKAYVMFN